MLNSVMNRHTPLRRTKGLERRTPMKRISAKQAKLNRDTRGLRRDPIEKFGVLCDFPKCNRSAEDPHEVTAGYSRPAAMTNPRLLMYVCREHHKIVQGLPYAKQIAIVVEAMVRAVNEVRACRCVSKEKVVLYLNGAGDNGL